jgi:hypothetical protein
MSGINVTARLKRVEGFSVFDCMELVVSGRLAVYAFGLWYTPAYVFPLRLLPLYNYPRPEGVGDFASSAAPRVAAAIPKTASYGDVSARSLARLRCPKARFHPHVYAHQLNQTTNRCMCTPKIQDM